MRDHFESEAIEALGELIKSRLTLIYTYVAIEGSYDKAFNVIEEIQEDIDELRHAAEIMKAGGPSTTGDKEDIKRLMKVAKRHLGELEDWVHIDKRDAQIKSAYLLTEAVDELQRKIRETK